MTTSEKIGGAPTGETLIAAIHSLSHKIMLLYSQIVFNQTGLNWQDWRILRAVVSLQSCRAMDICEESGLKKPHVSNGLARLEKAGHISRVRNPENARSKLVVCTKQGESLVNSATPVLENLSSRLALGEDELDSLSVLNELRAYESELGKMVEASRRPEPPPPR